MESTLTDLFEEMRRSRPPQPPTRAMIEALDRLPPLTPARATAPRPAEHAADELPAELPDPGEVKPARLPFRFEFRKGYYSIYTTQGDKFILREEHLAELRRLSTEYNRYNLKRTTPLSMSDIINAALDFVFEHALNLRSLESAEEVRDAIAKEVYRKAFFQFLRHYEMV